MATLASNVFYISLDGVDVSAYYTEGGLEADAKDHETTCGSAATHVARAAGLKDISLKVKLAYDDTNLAAYVAKLEPGQAYTVIVGPQGNGSGKPKHEQSMLLVKTNGPKVDVKKTPVILDLSFKGAAAPTSNFYAGAVFS